MVNQLGDVTVAVRARVGRIDAWPLSRSAARVMARTMVADGLTVRQVAAMPADLVLAYLATAEAPR